MRRTLMAAAVLALASCSTSTPTVTTTPVSTAAPTPAVSTSTPANTTSSTPKTARVGDTIDLTDRDTHIQVTLVKLVDPAKSTDEYQTPENGKRFVAVQMRIVNAGTKAYTGDPMAETQAKDADGQVFDADVSPADTAIGQRMDSGLTLAPGDKTLGVMTFEVPTGVKLVSMQYSTSMFSGNVAQWTLG